MNDGNLLYIALGAVHGGEEIYRHPANKLFNYTVGVREFARNAGKGAYWLLDILATEPAIWAQVRDDRFALVLLKVTGTKAKLTVDDGNGVVKYARQLDFTDCPEAPSNEDNPEGCWKFYIEQTYAGDQTVHLCMLPHER